MKVLDLSASQALADFAQTYPVVNPIVKSVLAGQTPPDHLDVPALLGEATAQFGRLLYDYLGMQQLLKLCYRFWWLQVGSYYPMTPSDAHYVLRSYHTGEGFKAHAIEVLGGQDISFEHFTQWTEHAQELFLNKVVDPRPIVDGILAYFDGLTNIRRAVESSRIDQFYRLLVGVIHTKGPRTKFQAQIDRQVRQRIAYWAASNQAKPLCKQLEKFDHRVKAYLVLGGYRSGVLFQDPKAKWLQSVEQFVKRHSDWSSEQVAQHLGLPLVLENLSQTLRV